MPHQLAAALLVLVVSVSEAFSPVLAPLVRQHGVSISSSSSSELRAAPILIISGFIKKRREEERKKNVPLAGADQMAAEAPGLRVGSGTWKWPPVWPYDDTFFRAAAAEPPVSATENLNSVASMFSGVAAPNALSEDDEDQQAKFDPLEYWNSAEGNRKTELDPEAVAKLKEHYAFYLKDGMSILEFGAADDSYLPDNIKPSRHVGIGASNSRMENNPSLTERLEVDLNKVVKDRDIDNDDVRRLAQEPFDAIIMANTIDFLSYPREVFRSAWYLLKPGGIMMVAFSGKEVTKDKFTEAQTKMWRDYNDDQHLWITGSFFQFSASDGWENLLGFDISPESAKKATKKGIEALMDRGKSNNIYVVQATKASQDAGIDPDDVERSLGSMSWMLPVLEQRDKGLLLPRLARAYETAESDKVREAIERNIPNLPKVYEALVKMDTFAFTLSMQSQLATDLICDPDFTAAEEQIVALKQGLGLRSPTEEFWMPIGQNTANMDIEERICLLAYLVPRFGSGNPEQEEALKSFASGLAPTYSVIRNKCSELSDADVELLGTELLATEVATVGRSTREEFAAWIMALEPDELRELLSLRKSLRESAKNELANYKEEIVEEQRQRDEYKQKYDDQIKAARESRSLYFNPKTRKMELLEQKK